MGCLEMDMMTIKESFKQHKKLTILILLWIVWMAFSYTTEDTGILWPIDIGIVFLLYYAWKYRKKNSNVSFLLISLAFMLSFFIEHYDIDHLVLYIGVLAPVMISVIFNCFFVKKKKGMTEKTRKIVLKCIFIFSWCVCFNEWLYERMYIEDIWEPLMISAMPLMYAILFRKISDISRGKHGNSYLKTTVGYFISCIVIFVFIGNVIFMKYPCARLNWEPDNGFYLVALALFVYIMETKSMYNCAGKKEKTGAVICGSLYVLAAVMLTVFGNERVRTLIYNMGGPAINIGQNPRENWFSYRSGLIRQFLSGNLKDIRYDMSSTLIGEIAVKFGYISLIIVMLLVSALVLALMLKRWKDSDLNRMKNYLAVSYLIRGGVGVLYCFLVLPINRLSFPFISAQSLVFDVMILYYMAKENQMRKVTVS